LDRLGLIRLPIDLITVAGLLVTFQSIENFGTQTDPVSIWIEQLAACDPTAASQLWEHFCLRLMSYARGRLNPKTRRVYDEEDAAISAFRSLCKGIEAQKFPDVGDRGNLWALLVVITSRKILNRHRHENQACRDTARTISDSVFQTAHSAGVGVLSTLPSREPTPEFAAEVAEMSENLYSMLPDSDLRQLVTLKLEGYTNEEAADQMKVTRRTVQRKLERIRRLWLESIEFKPDLK